MTITNAPASTSGSTTTPIAPAVDNDTSGNDPSVPSAAYARNATRWKKTRACWIGTEAIREGAEDYLVRYAAESDADYDARRKLAAFYNGYGRTIAAVVGMLLEEGVTLDDKMPTAIVDLAENIDASGSHLNVFSRKLTTAGVVDGYSGIFVDYMRADDPTIDTSTASAAADAAIATGAALDSADEQALGLRPYFVLFKADDVIKAVYQTVKGVRTLVLLILREVVSERVGKFGIRTVTYYRTYTNENGAIYYQTWKADATGSTPQSQGELKRIENQTEIPWSPFVAGDEIAPGEIKPCLMDLADLNIQYHNSLTNHLSLQALAYVPTPVRIGAPMDDDGNYPPITLGPRNTIEAPQMDGVTTPIYWLSPPVDVLDAGERTLASTKADMGTLGAAFLSSETRAAETAEGKRIDSAASRASISTVSIALKDCLERAFGFVAKYLKTKAGSVTLNEDFTGERIDPTYLAVLITAYQNDVITLQELRYIIQTGQLPEDFDPDDAATLVALTSAAKVREEQKQLAAAAAQNPNNQDQQPPLDNAA